MGRRKSQKKSEDRHRENQKGKEAKACSKNSQEEESPLPTSTLVSVMVLESNGVFLGGRSLLPVKEGEGRGGRVDVGLVEGSLELDSPLGSRSIHSKEGNTHDETE